MKRRIAQPLVVLPMAMILVLAFSVVALSAQLEPVVPDIGFEIEGNTGLDNAGSLDWENSIPPGERITDPNSRIETDPTVFLPNSKFDDPADWSIRAGRVGPGQSELVSFLVRGIQPGDLGGGRPSDYWLVLGMERIKVPGFFEMDFEYNQVAWEDESSGGPIRTSGDVLVGFELRGKPTSKRAAYKVLLLQFWPGTQPSKCSTTLGPGGDPEFVGLGTEPCPAYGESGWYYRLLDDDGLSADSGLVQATMNQSPFPASWLRGDVGDVSPYEFAEAAINLTALGIEPDCSAPGSVHAKSRSAPHIHSDLKDLVGPVMLECEPARLDGHKFLDADGDGTWDMDEPPLPDWEIGLSDGSSIRTNEDGYYAFEDLAYGTYTVSEVCPPDEEWVQSAPTPADPDSCGEAVYTVDLDSGNREVNDLNFGNHPPPPDLAVSKDAETTFSRTYLWTVTKMVDDEGPILLYPGDYAEVLYELVADLADPAYVDSDWTVEGTITIENLGAADVELASVTDMISPGDIAAPVDCEEWLVPGLGSVTCTYGPVELPDGSDRTNTVTVKVEGSSDGWNATADIRFDEPTTEIDEEVHVTDTNWEDEQWEGPDGFDVGFEKTPWVITYPWKVWAPGNECGLFEYPNTATLVTNDLAVQLEADAIVEILEVCEVTIAYEDLPVDLGNDWDYNDLVVHVPLALEISEFGDLLAANFEIAQEPVLSAFSHAFNIHPCAELCSCTGTWVKTETRDGSVTTTTGVYDPEDPDKSNFLLIPDSTDPPDLVELRIEFDVEKQGDCPRYCGEPDPVNMFHGEWLFFDPWLTVYPRPTDPLDPYEIHVLRDDPEPRILTVPAAWVPPPEKTPIWEVYDPCVEEGDDGLPEFSPYWWLCAP